MLLFSNQQVSQTVAESPMIAEVVMDDLEVFVMNSAEQAAGVTSRAANEAIRSVNRDLDGRIYFKFCVEDNPKPHHQLKLNKHAKTNFGYENKQAFQIKPYLPCELRIVSFI